MLCVESCPSHVTVRRSFKPESSSQPRPPARPSVGQHTRVRRERQQALNLLLDRSANLTGVRPHVPDSVHAVVSSKDEVGHTGPVRLALVLGRALRQGDVARISQLQLVIRVRHLQLHHPRLVAAQTHRGVHLASRPDRRGR